MTIKYKPKKKNANGDFLSRPIQVLETTNERQELKENQKYDDEINEIINYLSDPESSNIPKNNYTKPRSIERYTIASDNVLTIDEKPIQNRTNGLKIVIPKSMTREIIKKPPEPEFHVQHST